MLTTVNGKKSDSLAAVSADLTDACSRYRHTMDGEVRQADGLATGSTVVPRIDTNEKFLTILDGKNGLRLYVLRIVGWHLLHLKDGGARSKVVSRIIYVATHAVTATTRCIERNLVNLQICSGGRLDTPLDVAVGVVINLIGRPVVTSQQVSLHLTAGIIARPVGPHRIGVRVRVTLHVHALECLGYGSGRTDQLAGIVFLQAPVGLYFRTSLQRNGSSLDRNLDGLVALTNCDGAGGLAV